MTVNIKTVWKRLGKLDKAFLILLLFYIVLLLAVPASGFVSFLQIILFVLGAWLVIRLSRFALRKAIWRLRNRILVTYVLIADAELFRAMDDVLRLQSASGGKLPLTLVVLDELQQYINDDGQKALAVQNIVEGISAKFESQVLFVATGQSALTARSSRVRLIESSKWRYPTGCRNCRPRSRAPQEPRAVLSTCSRQSSTQSAARSTATSAEHSSRLRQQTKPISFLTPLLPTRRRF